ncbi:MAG TPA: transglycosylase domain-containing protein [Pseudonocardiaceae bacterium]
MNDHRDDEPRDGQPSWPTGGDPDAGTRGPQGGTPGGTPATPNGPQRGTPARPAAGPVGGPGVPGGPRQGGPGRPTGPGGPRGQMRPGGLGRPGAFNQGPPADRATDHLPPVPDPNAKYRPEPSLLTHRDDDYLQDAEAGDHRDLPPGLTAAEAKQLKHRRAWRWVRRVMYVLIFLGVTTPIAAFYLIYQNVTVPDPKTVAFGQAQPITYYYADGSVMDKISTNARIFITANDIPPNVRRAVEAAEDETFETNNGFDMKAIARTAYNQLTGGTGGGSTITQEYIKVATGNNQHSISRKVNEAVEAYKMTKTYTDKNDILAAYLNTVYFGRGAYGIESAARLYYNVAAKDLSPQQAALLAGMIQLPGDAGIPSYQLRRFTYVWGRMLANHWITSAQFTAGKFPTPLPLSQTQQQSIPWDRQLIVNQVDAELGLDGWTTEALKSHGAQIYTSIDPKAMTDAENSIASHLATDTQFTNGQPIVLNGRPVTNDGGPVTPNNPQVKGTETAALVSINPSTGEVVAYYGGNDQKTTEIDSASTPHQPGSSFKPYVLAAGLEYQPDKIGLNAIFDTKSQKIQGVLIKNADGDTCATPCTVKDAMTNSINVVFYLMGQQVGSEHVRDAALQAGIPKTEKIAGNTVQSLSEPGSTASNLIVHGGIAIGQYDVRPIDQAQGYATFANNGMYNKAHFVKKVTDNTGQPLYQFSAPATPAFGSDPTTSARIARTVSDAMSNVAQNSGFSLSNGRPADAKTGTQDFSLATSRSGTNYNSQAWTIGFTPQLVTAVWFGHYDKPGPVFGRGNGGGGGTYNVFGRMEPGSIWKTYMDTYLSNQPMQQFATAPPEIGGSWDFVNNVDASTENTPSTTTTQPPSNQQPPQQTSDQPTQPPTDTTTKRHGPPPTTTVCNPIVQPCPPPGGVPTG